MREEIKKYSHYISGTVLDVGSGTGNRYKDLFKYQKYTTMDVYEGDGIDIVAKAEKIPLPDSSIDSVVCTQVFEHLKYPFESSREIYRVMKKGGHLLLTVPQMNELHEEPNDFFRYTKFGLISMFEEAGFRTIAYEQRGGFFTTVAQIKIRYLIDRFKLYKRPLLGKIVCKFVIIYAKSMMWLDKLDKSEANRKNTLGWCFVFQK